MARPQVRENRIEDNAAAGVWAAGSSIHRCAVAWLVEWTTVESSRSFSSAEMRPGGYRVISMPDTSANVSRRRLTASCMTRAISGARASSRKPKIDSSAWGPPPPPCDRSKSLWRLRPMPHHNERMPMSARIATTPTIVTARVDTRMS